MFRKKSKPEMIPPKAGFSFIIDGNTIDIKVFWHPDLCSQDDLMELAKLIIEPSLKHKNYIMNKMYLFSQMVGDEDRFNTLVSKLRQERAEKEKLSEQPYIKPSQVRNNLFKDMKDD